MRNVLFFTLFLLHGFSSCAQFANSNIAGQYNKIERMIPMRDGVKLFTSIYVPKNKAVKYPFLITRTPYSCAPYGELNYPQRLGPSNLFANEPFIFVFQDVRGRYMSEGNFEEVTPHVEVKKTKKDTDESSDCFDTIEWLLKNIDNNNGNAGLYGISYPGFYASAALPGAHPALKAVSPQAPVTDEFEGDDAYHRGAFFLMDNFGFLNNFDHPRETPWMRYPQIFNAEIDNAYDFYLRLGPLKNANEQYFKGKSKIWNEYLQHDTKDAYWQKRDIRTHLTDIKPAVLVVGGWYDAEDLFGSLETYKAINTNTANNQTRLIMGPWTHGSWSRGEWSRYGSINFGSNTSRYFQHLEFKFFVSYLKGKEPFNAPEASIFETGSNTWKEYSSWPPTNALPVNCYLGGNNSLYLNKQAAPEGYDEYVSDPLNPVPYINEMSATRNNDYMVADQSFASKRNDVITYTSEVLNSSITLSGPITANLFITTSSTDVDLVVKVIDVLPDSSVDNMGRNIDGMQRLVRAEVIRGKFRNSYSQPEAFTPGKITNVQFQLNDVAHSFLKGHKIMLQVQSSWFPLVDRNPQKFMPIPQANAEDFQKATIRIYHNEQYPSSIGVLQVNN